ncbi:MAG: hypothetical protein JXR70_05385 [Spirochaetales bacterium]|nr:hypothetical protein [Spirochaetales bacterium]
MDDLKIQVDAKKLEKSHAFTLQNGDIVRRNLITREYAHELLQKQIKTINIIPDNQTFITLMKILRTNHPDQFPEPSRVLELGEVEKVLMQYQEMNKYSEKIRELFLLQELSSKPHPVSGLRETIMPYNSKIELKDISRLRKYFSDNEPLEVRESEQGVLIVTIAMNQQDTLNTIMSATDLVARLEKHFNLDLAYEISEAIEKFRLNNPRLVVFGNYKFRGQTNDSEVNPKAQHTYLELRNLDIYMKSLFIDQVNLEEQREKLAKEIMRAYKEPYNVQKVDSKLPLSDLDKSKYLNLLDRLNRNFDRHNYLKLSIQLKMLESTYYVENLKNQLVNIEKLHAFDPK